MWADRGIVLAFAWRQKYTCGCHIDEVYSSCLMSLQYFMHTSRSQGVHFPQNRPASANCILHRRKSTGSINRTHSGKLSFCTGVDSMPLALYGLQLCPNLVSRRVPCHYKFKHTCTRLTVHCNA